MTNPLSRYGSALHLDMKKEADEAVLEKLIMGAYLARLRFRTYADRLRDPEHHHAENMKQAAPAKEKWNYDPAKLPRHRRGHGSTG